jgi:DNA-binding NtrC family response regulator
VTASTSAPRPATNDEAGPLAGGAPRAVRVLVVDDEPGMRRSLGRALETRGMKVAVAEDGALGLEYIERTPPEVALVDATMPGLGGLEVLARVRAMGTPCEVIVMTAFGDVDSAVAAMKAGAHGFLTKPFHSPDAVAHAVWNAAAQRRLRDRSRSLEEALLTRERFGAIVLSELAALPYAEAKRRLVTHFDEAYTGELLRKTGGNLSEAARQAGLDRSNFRRLLKRHRDAP